MKAKTRLEDLFVRAAEVLDIDVDLAWQTIRKDPCVALHCDMRDFMGVVADFVGAVIDGQEHTPSELVNFIGENLSGMSLDTTTEKVVVCLNGWVWVEPEAEWSEDDQNYAVSQGWCIADLPGDAHLIQRLSVSDTGPWAGKKDDLIRFLRSACGGNDDSFYNRACAILDIGPIG